MTRRIGTLDLKVLGNIIVSWVVTLPIAAVLSALFFFALKGIFV